MSFELVEVTPAYKPCPWGANHPVGPKQNELGNGTRAINRVGCKKSTCPMFHVSMSAVEWNARDDQ